MFFHISWLSARKRTGRNKQGGEEKKKRRNKRAWAGRHTGILSAQWPWAAFYFHFHEVTGQMSDLAVWNLTEHKWVWRQRVCDACVGGYRGVVLSLHYERMTTNEEICRTILHFTSANHKACYTCKQRLGPICCDTEQSGEGGIEMRSKKERERVRERGRGSTEEQISGLKERQRKRGMTKRSDRVKWKDRGGDGWERRGGETAASSTHLQHSSYRSVWQQAGRRVDRQKTTTTRTPAASCWCQS